MTLTASRVKVCPGVGSGVLETTRPYAHGTIVDRKYRSQATNARYGRTSACLVLPKATRALWHPEDGTGHSTPHVVTHVLSWLWMSPHKEFYTSE